MERTPLMEGKEFDMFIHGPFATGVYLDAGKLSSIDDDFLREFVGESKNQIRESKNQIIECSKDSIPYMKQRINGIKLVLRNDREVSNSIIYKFENNTINLYECGTGLFSTQVTLTFQSAEKADSIDSVKKAEELAKDIVTKKFENVLLNISKIFSDIVNKQDIKKGIRKLTWIESDYFKIGHLDWLHSVYYFCRPDFFEDNGRLKAQAKENILTDLSFLPDQIHHEISSSMGRYVFITNFGFGRSLFITKETFSVENVIRLRRLLETFQYFYYGLYQLDTFLLKKMYKGNTDIDHQKKPSESIDQRLKKMYKGNTDIDHQKKPSETIEDKLEDLKKMIEELDKHKSSILKYLEQFRYGSTFLVGPAGQRLLVEELEEQWDMERMEDGIRNKLDLFGRELSSKEQALLAKEQEVFSDEQRYLNKIILVFTVVSLGSLTAQVVDLSPWSEAFELKTIFYKTQLWIVLISTGLLVGIILLLYSKKLQKMRLWQKKGGKFNLDEQGP